MGVFDGHGKIGEYTSQFVIDNLPTTLANDPDYPTDRTAAIKKAFVNVDNALGKHIDASVSGTTAVACLLQGNKALIGNAGDSRAIIARKGKKPGKLVAHDLTEDQKPDTPAERVRIERMGGRVSEAAADGTPARVWHNFRGLAMARSIGDHNAKTVGVIAEPEVCPTPTAPNCPAAPAPMSGERGAERGTEGATDGRLAGEKGRWRMRRHPHTLPPRRLVSQVTDYTFTPDDQLLIIASDGVWEFLSSQDVCDIAAQVVDPTINHNTVCDLIVKKAAESWEREEGDYRDDITCVCLALPWLPTE